MAEVRQSPLSLQRMRLASLGARHPDEFFGGRAALAELGRRLRRSPRRAPQSIVLSAPRGAGKSELLRQAALAWSDPAAELTPVCLDLARLLERAAGDAARARTALVREALRQILLAAGRISPESPASPSALEAACAAEPWKGLAGFAEAQGDADDGGCEALLDAAIRVPVARPLVILDGLSALDPAAGRRWLASLVPAAQRAGCPLLLESPADPAAAGLWDLPDIEIFSLPSLSADEALALVRVAAEGRGASLAAADCLPVCERLGFWPGWLVDWTRAIPFEPVGANPRRIAEEAYVALLDGSPWSRRLLAGFESAVPPALREKGLRIAQKAAGEEGTIGIQKIADRLDASPEEADRAMRGMAALGLAEPAGARWRGTRLGALADWIALQLASADGAEACGEARLSLLSAKLAAPQPELAAGVARPASRLAPEILARFDGQSLPEAFFKYYDYYEAAGRLDPRRRREAMLQSRRTIVVPETVGVAGGGGAGRGAEFQARAFRGGKYQHYAEELWIALDLSATRSLTTPEIERAIERAARERKRTGVETCVLWLIVGETVSPDGLELLRREKIFCSNLEQLAILRELLAEESVRRRAEAARAQESGAGGQGETPHPASGEPAGIVARPVIDLKPEREPRAETTTLRLPAREESEYIAALMAEKVAIRADFGATEAGKIKTAVLEGTLNAIEHSPNPEKMIDIQFRLSPEAMEIVIENEGARFDPSRVEPPDPKVKLAAGNKRGWGIALMKKFMDEVEYEPCSGGTRARLVKRRMQSGPAAAEERGEKSKGRI